MSLKLRDVSFNYSAPVTTYQLLQSNYTLYQDLLPTPTGINLTLVRKLLQHHDLNQWLKFRVQMEGQRNPVTTHHDTEEIHCILTE